MKRGELGKPPSSWPGGDSRSQSATEHIRAAEKHLQGKHYGRALESLRYAQKCEPDNKYILAIIERVLSMSKTDVQAPEPEVTPEPNRYLSVTVGPEFEGGIKPADQPAPESIPHDLVKEFTSIALGYMKIGLPEAAFDALMKAYLIDPIDPDVISCEREVIPVWNQARAAAALPKERVLTASDNTTAGFQSRPPEHQPTNSGTPDATPEFSATIEAEAPVASLPVNPQTPAPPPPANEIAAEGPEDQDDPWATIRPRRQEMTPEERAQRLEMLMQKKESERRERERELYRAASRLPKILEDTQKDDTEFHLDRPSRTARAARGLLRRFKKG